MSQSVFIKGYKDGIKILVTKEIAYDEFIEELTSIFSEKCNFFRNAHVALLIEGIHLTEKQELQIIELIEALSQMKIICIIDQDEIQNARFEKAVQAQEYLKQNRSGLYISGDIKNGQMLETQQSIVILGNVDAGAKIFSGANVIVVGGLYGYVAAGLDNETSSYIVALDMNPKTLRINQIVAHGADILKNIRQPGPKIAYLTKERIYIDSINIF